MADHPTEERDETGRRPRADDAHSERRRLAERRKQAQERSRTRRDEAKREAARRKESAKKAAGHKASGHKGAHRGHREPALTDRAIRRQARKRKAKQRRVAKHGWRPPRWKRRVVAGVAVLAVLAGAAAVYLLPRRVSEQPTQAGIRVAGLEFDKDRAWADLERQVSFGPRVPGTDAHEDGMRYIAEELAASEWKVKRDRFAEPSGRGETLKMTNVEARHPRQLGNVKPVLLVAHYDSRPTADEEKRPEDRRRPIPGANDGASGVAVLLEVARQIAARPDDYVHVQLVFVDGEDWPEFWAAGEPQGAALHGSKHLAAKISSAEGPPRYRYGLVIDMVGDRRLHVLREQHSVEASQGLVSRVWRTGQSVAPGAFGFEPGPRIKDDHVPLIEAGVPTCLIIDFDYRYWHTLEDAPDKCSPDSLEDIGRTVLSVLRRK